MPCRPHTAAEKDLEFRPKAMNLREGVCSSGVSNRTVSQREPMLGLLGRTISLLSAVFGSQSILGKCLPLLFPHSGRYGVQIPSHWPFPQHCSLTSLPSLKAHKIQRLTGEVRSAYKALASADVLGGVTWCPHCTHIKRSFFSSLSIFWKYIKIVS